MKRTRARLLLLMAAGTASSMASTASHLYRQGLKAEHAGSIAQAYLYYSEASAADPKKLLYRQRAEALAPQAAMEAKVKPVEAALAEGTPPIAGKDADPRPESVFDTITARDLAATAQLQPPATLTLAPDLRDFDLDGDFKALFEKLAQQLNLEVLFDGDFPPGRHLRFRLEQATPRDALHALEAATGSFVIPLSAKLMMVAQDTEVKRKDLEQMATAVVPVPNVLTAQEITELGQAVKQTVGAEHLYWDALANEIVIRDRVSRVMATQSILQQLAGYRAEVAIDLQFIEVSESEMLDIGADVEPSFPIVFINSLVQGTNGVSATLAAIRRVGIRNLFSVSMPTIDVIAQMSAAGAKTLLKTTIISVEGQPAEFHAGEKYPIVTSAYLGSTSIGLAPSFTFEDLGLSVKLTPHASANREVAMDVESEFKLLGAGQFNGIPVISDRKIHSILRLKSDQWALVSGLTSSTTSRNWTGPALFSRIPILGNLVSRFTRQKQRTYILLAIKPRILSTPPDQVITHQVFVGSQTKSVTPL